MRLHLSPRQHCSPGSPGTLTIRKRDCEYLSARPQRYTIHQMTITYPNGITIDALPLSTDVGMLRVAVAGEDDVRVFHQVDGIWQSEDGQRVQLMYAWQKDTRVPVPEEDHFICSKELGQQLISSLMSGSEIEEGEPAPLYVFSAEKRRLHITVVRGHSAAG